MSGPAEAVGLLRAAGATDPGRLREVNEDRFHVDIPRGLFIVIDGVGGQAAGGKAADTAAGMMRARLERETGPLVSRLREAITVANNEIHRLAGLRAEWTGMACVLTAVVVRGAHALVGHVGDTRLYKLRRGAIQKITRDHSPVGEREDARELSEQEAMQHPRRNEVYRDVGSEPHEPADPDFIDIQDVDFEADAALLLCSDGLTDLVDSTSINDIVRRWAGRPQMVAEALIEAANAAGGKDNVTVVYVEGEQFAASGGELPGSPSEITRRLTPVAAASAAPRRRQAVRLANIVLIAIVIVLTFVRSDNSITPGAIPALVEAPSAVDRIVVQPPETIRDAMLRARPGTTIVVEPGVYRESVILKSGVHLVSSVARGATLRLPGTASERAAAIVADGVTGASVAGFVIVGDAATPLGTGIAAINAGLSIMDVEIAGAKRAAIDVGPGSSVRVAGTSIRDNPGSAVAVRSGGALVATLTQFARNGTAGGQKTLALDAGAEATFTSNVFVDTTPAVFTGSNGARAAFARDNWFPPFESQSRPAATPSPGRRGR
jgi:serine/threonine protein phosphatase PrpC